MRGWSQNRKTRSVLVRPNSGIIEVDVCCRVAVTANVSSVAQAQLATREGRLEFIILTPAANGPTEENGAGVITSCVESGGRHPEVRVGGRIFGQGCVIADSELPSHVLPPAANTTVCQKRKRGSNGSDRLVLRRRGSRDQPFVGHRCLAAANTRRPSSVSQQRTAPPDRTAQM